jgi:hypothetical protein
LHTDGRAEQRIATRESLNALSRDVQWSCHKVTSRGASPPHEEWLNDVDVWPNQLFADSPVWRDDQGGRLAPA